MHYKEVSWYSPHCNRDMRIKVYGHYGVPFICFPCLNKQSDDFYNNGMIDALSDFINDGRIKLFCVDTIDDENVESHSWDRGHATYMLDQYHNYIVEEVVPFVKFEQGGDAYPYLFGCSMGASHAAINFFRRPELFSGFIGLSGNYDMSYFFNDHFDSYAYNNSPVHFLENMDPSHPYINIYNSKTMIVCIGSGAFEYLVSYSNDWLKHVTDKKGINVWYNFWDNNAVHDWSSWHYEARYFISRVI